MLPRLSREDKATRINVRCLDRVMRSRVVKGVETLLNWHGCSDSVTPTMQGSACGHMDRSAAYRSMDLSIYNVCVCAPKQLFNLGNLEVRRRRKLDA